MQTNDEDNSEMQSRTNLSDQLKGFDWNIFPDVLSQSTNSKPQYSWL